MATAFASEWLVVKAGSLLNLVQSVIFYRLDPSLKLDGHLTGYFAELSQHAFTQED